MNQPLIHIMYLCGKNKANKGTFHRILSVAVNSSETAMQSTALWYTTYVSTIGVEMLAKSRGSRLPGHLEISRSTGYLFPAWLFSQSNFRAPASIASLYCHSCRKHLVRHKHQLRMTLLCADRSSILVSLSSKAEVQLHLFLVFMQPSNCWINGRSELTQGKKAKLHRGSFSFFLF